jgi:hypothetical protein
VVVKDVNPLALRWLLARYRPHLVFLVRHPAAVAESHHRLHWPRVVHDGSAPAGDPWERYGREQAVVLAEALAATEGYRDVRFVVYEELCRMPLEVFRELYAFSGLSWTAPIAERAAAQSATGGTDYAYDVSRVSGEMPDLWRRQLDRDVVARIRRGYGSRPLPWYQDDGDWEVDRAVT